MIKGIFVTSLTNLEIVAPCYHEREGMWLIEQVAKEFNPGRIIELGTLQGGLTILLANACPDAPTVRIVADGAKLPFPDESQDYVLALHNLEHYHQSTLIILREWHRVLKPGGICAVIVPDGDRKMDAFYAGSGEHFHIFTVPILALYFRAAKFNVIKCEKVDRLPERPEQTILCVGRK